jgi:nicotinamidase/pyrazinamidase
MTRFVIAVDCQNDFMAPKGALYVPGADGIVQNIQRFLDGLNTNDYCGVLFTLDSHRPTTYTTSEEAKSFPPHCYVGTTGWQLAVDTSRLIKTVPCYQIRKNVFNMWQEPGLLIKKLEEDYDNPMIDGVDRDVFFDNLAIDEGVTTIVIVGVAADYCVKWAIEGAIHHKFYVDVVRGCTKGIDNQIEDVIEAFPGHTIYIVEE